MPRRREIPKRSLPPDPVYDADLVTRFINCLMLRGKRSVAERVFYEAMTVVADKSSEDPVRVFRKALDNVKPVVETKSRRVGGSTYQVPVEVNQHRRTSLGIRWMITFARQRNEKTMVARLANEILEAANYRGGAVRKKEDVHRMAEANKAFAHYRW